MNKLAAILNYKPQAGTEYIRHYSRIVEIPAEFKSTAQILVPDNPDDNYRNFMVDQLVTLVNHTAPDLLKELDPANTYDYLYARKKAEPTASGLPADVTISFMEEAGASTDWLQDTIFVRVDVTNDTVTLEGKEYPLDYQDNATAAIEYKPGFKFMLRGSMFGTFAFHINACRPPYRDLTALISKLKMSNTEWLPKYEPLVEYANPEAWLAIFILNYFEQVLDNVHNF